MCAIAGVLDLNADDHLIHSMLDTMRRRGPDSTGWYQKEACTLLHARLAVIDPDGGKQPMTLFFLPNGKSKNTVASMQHILPPLGIAVEQHLRVGMPLKSVSQSD